MNIDYFKLLPRAYSNRKWSIANNEVEWLDGQLPPTDQDLQQKWLDYKFDIEAEPIINKINKTAQTKISKFLTTENQVLSLLKYCSLLHKALESGINQLTTQEKDKLDEIRDVFSQIQTISNYAENLKTTIIAQKKLDIQENWPL